jgi:hypothetical protein
LPLLQFAYFDHTADGQVKRAASKFGLVAMTGELAIAGVQTDFVIGPGRHRS